MKQSIDHLPEQTQKELSLVLKHIKRRTNKVKMVILFGSYAKDTFVVRDDYEKDNRRFSFQSDYDLLLVVRNNSVENDINLWRQLEQNVYRDKKIEAPVSFIIENIEQLNEKISDGRSFYVDIVKEGIVLESKDNIKLVKPRQLTPKERQEMAQGDFDMFYKKAQMVFGTYKFHMGEAEKDADHFSLAAFHLHQVTEALFTALELTFTGYKAKQHCIEKLYESALNLDPSLKSIFPMETEEERHKFELLKRAYIDARYEKKYSITKEELEWLAGRIQVFMKRTKKLCERKIEELGGV